MSSDKTSVQSQKSSRKIHPSVWVLGLVSLFTDFGTKAVQSVLPLFLVSVLGANISTVGLIEGIAESTASVLKLFSGALSDYWGRRKELAILGYGLSAAIIPVFALANSPFWVLVGRFGDRLGKGIRVAPRNALVADVTPPEQRGAAYGLRQTLDTIGAFSGPLVATLILLISEQNFRLVFWVALIPGIISVCLLVKGIREPQSAERKRNASIQWSVCRRLGRNYWALVGVAMLFNLGNFSDAFLLLKAQEIGITATWIPLSMIVMNFSYMLSAYPLGALSDRMGRKQLLVGGFWLFALVYLGFAWIDQPWQIWGLFAFYGVYLGMSQGILLALVADFTPPELRGTGFGIINLVIGIILLPASLLAGFLWQTVNSQTPFLLGSVLAIAASLLLLIGIRNDN
ncbi:MFS transporter [Crocosphaera sp. Alani8]|uniref:MFS transporter n=1 Tax=Crocosphaera sp. Alani8 TaxID=3038952 RepID=UPI00313E71ED